MLCKMRFPVLKAVVFWQELLYKKRAIHSIIEMGGSFFDNNKANFLPKRQKEKMVRAKDFDI